MSDTKQILIKSAVITGLFLALAPGFIVNFPPVDEVDGSKGKHLFSGKVDVKSTLFAGGLFFLGSAGIFYAAKKYWSNSTIGAALASQPYARSW